jgi:phospho-N-acetylmuramoyl-pentapeptide-transferase
MVNAVNLTDGIDGLSSSVTAVVAVFFSVCAFHLVRPELAVLPATVVGGTVGFLMYNFYPAKIFMGDTGSLYLGGMVVGMAFMLGNPLIIVVAGIIYIVEVLSDILQVGYFKISHGKRIFKMAPIHHHFEKCGWSEVKIVLVFTAVTIVACVAAFFGIQV